MSDITRTLTPVYSNKESASRVSGKTEIKIAYIGGGSREWAIKLMTDLALSEHLKGTLELYDIDHNAARHNQILAESVFKHEQALTQFDVAVASSLESALRDADFVIISIEPGPINYRHADLEIPARYGVLQTVGDTTGPGGVMRAMRCATLFEQFGRTIEKVCPQAWVINYTNPMAVCTASLFRGYPDLKAFGCCHEVFGTQEMLAKRVAEWFDVEIPSRTEIKLDISGVNHFTWAASARWQGNDLFPLLDQITSNEELFASKANDALKQAEAKKWFSGHYLIAFDLFRRFGALGAAGDRHLVEFVPWYLSGMAELYRWGVVATPYSWRLERTTGPRKALAEIANQPLASTGEEGVLQMEAILGLRSLTTNINLPNRGQLPGAPKGIVVETYAEFTRNSVRPLLAAQLPAGARLLIDRAVQEQSILSEAMAARSLDLAFQAMLASPLVTIPTDKAYAMFMEMVDETKAMLGEWE
ncbi:alpha-galactosidase [Cerasicoccus arenae]|uniref:Alpha-galacturonidase n=1 Tax=Cerasicoccus arenae TaxID=424488 RepID=A0A8J3DC26_9BACT|nr:alpha-galactosidase [Cerasicoccus arenae]MBK1859245.1 hypothetical protein [Cerasicoccus arenae]GHC02835.1 alpha-galacturonidase [Cerasicoccus arenae]